MKLLAALLLLSASSFAASWDGTKGIFTVVTVQSDAVNILPNSGPRFVTYISVSSSDPRVNGFQITVRHLDDFGNQKTVTAVADLPANGIPFATAIFCQTSQIVSGIPTNRLPHQSLSPWKSPGARVARIPGYPIDVPSASKRHAPRFAIYCLQIPAAELAATGAESVAPQRLSRRPPVPASSRPFAMYLWQK